MMKAWRSLSRNLPSELSGKSSDVREALWLHSITSKAGISTAAQGINSKGSAAGRVFAPYTIYKGKASLAVEPILPQFAKLDSGNIKLERKGVMLLTFVPAIGERKYDYQKKQSFALSPTEVGSLINMGRQDSAEFFHDPSMLSSNAGQVRKSLSIKAQDGGNGYFFSLSIANNILKSNERLSVPVTSAEFAVVKTACNFVLPHLMGWNRLANQSDQLLSGIGRSSRVDQKPLDWENEWAK